MTAKVLYDKCGEVAYITLNRPEVKNAIDIESHELLCDIWRDLRDDPELRVASSLDPVTRSPPAPT
jgi:enoyl-CoA hydratase/carnithine racemase